MVLKRDRKGGARVAAGGGRTWPWPLREFLWPVPVAGMVEAGRGGPSGTPTLEVWGRGLDLVGPQAQAAGVDIVGS